MKTANLERIKKLNKSHLSRGTVTSSCNCSWNNNVHISAKKSTYEEQNIPE